MRNNYSLVSPSLEGFLSHESLSYEGIMKPVEILRELDGRSAAGQPSKEPHETKILERYFYDLYGVFMKRLSSFVLEPLTTDAETVRLLAMLQEMVKVKKLMR